MLSSHDFSCRMPARSHFHCALLAEMRKSAIKEVYIQHSYVLHWKMLSFISPKERHLRSTYFRDFHYGLFSWLKSFTYFILRRMAALALRHWKRPIITLFIENFQNTEARYDAKTFYLEYRTITISWVWSKATFVLPRWFLFFISLGIQHAPFRTPLLSIILLYQPQKDCNISTGLPSFWSFIYHFRLFVMPDFRYLIEFRATVKDATIWCRAWCWNMMPACFLSFVELTAFLTCILSFHNNAYFAHNASFYLPLHIRAWFSQHRACTLYSTIIGDVPAVSPRLYATIDRERY